MKRWILFFSFFTVVVFISFFSFLILNKTSFIQAAISKKTALSCSIGSISFGLKQQTVSDIKCTLPDQASLSIKTLSLDLSLPALILWSINPFEPNLKTGKWEASNIDFQIVAKSSDSSQNSWTDWVHSLPKQSGHTQLHRVSLRKIKAQIRNNTPSQEATKLPTFSTTVCFAREPTSLQMIVAEVVTALNEEVARMSTSTVASTSTNTVEIAPATTEKSGAHNTP